MTSAFDASGLLILLRELVKGNLHTLVRDASMRIGAVVAILLCFAASAGSKAEEPARIDVTSCPPPVVETREFVSFVERVLEPGPLRLDEIKSDVKQPGVAETIKAHAELAGRDWAYLCRYARDNAMLANAPRPEAVFIGDSITENWARADPAFFAGIRVDRGISGQTSPQVLVRFYQDVIALHPRVVHLMIGTNDLAGNTGPTTDETFQNNVRAILDLANVHGIAVVLAGIPPARNLFWSGIDPRPRISKLNHWLEAEAARRGATFVDYGTVLRADDGGLREALSNDGVHPNRNGYAKMRPLAERAVEKARRRAGRRCVSSEGD